MSGKRYFLSFVEEAVMNPQFAGYIGGRVEIIPDDSATGYSSEEIRFFTKDTDGFYALREKWDFIEVNEKSLDELRRTIGEKYFDRVN